jgi:hypothetical protein
MNPQEKNRIRNFLIRRVDYPTLESIIDQNYRYVENEFDPDYDFHNFNYGLATIIVEDLHIMDHIDLHIEHMYNDLIDYFYDTLKNRTRKLYDKLTNNTNLQEQIRKVLKEETNTANMVFRRVTPNELEQEFNESLIFAVRIFNKRDTMSLAEFRNYTISNTIDGIHWLIESTTPEDTQWYDNVFYFLKSFFGDRIEEKYNKLIGNE